VKIDEKIRDQLKKRGWTEEEIENLTGSNEPTGVTTDNRGPAKTEDGEGRNDTASVYGKPSEYVVVNDRTKEVVQVSNKTDPGWIDDSRIEWGLSK